GRRHSRSCCRQPANRHPATPRTRTRPPPARCSSLRSCCLLLVRAEWRVVLVPFRVMGCAEPPNVQRLRVVIVVCLGLILPADFAGLPGQPTVADCVAACCRCGLLDSISLIASLGAAPKGLLALLGLRICGPSLDAVRKVAACSVVLPVVLNLSSPVFANVTLSAGLALTE